MKEIVFVFLAFTSVTVNAQLKNTKWKGTIQADNNMNVILNYKTDTLNVSNADDGSNIETMTYTVKDSVVTLQKVYGQSNCDGIGKGKYNFDIKNDLLYLKLLSDSCSDRSGALNNSTWMKTK